MRIKDTPAVVALRQARHELVQSLRGRCYNCRHCVVVEEIVVSPDKYDAWCRCEENRWRREPRKKMSSLEDQAAIECGYYQDARDKDWNDEA